jgi:hypothetical protein
MNSTGPGGYTKVIQKHLPKVFTLPSKLFMRFSSADTEEMDCKEVALKEGAYNYPLVGNSWHSWDSTMIHYILLYRKSLTIFFVILIFYIIYRTIKKK